jgi:hypothetical protein
MSYDYDGEDGDYDDDYLDEDVYEDVVGEEDDEGIYGEYDEDDDVDDAPDNQQREEVDLRGDAEDYDADELEEQLLAVEGAIKDLRRLIAQSPPAAVGPLMLDLQVQERRWRELCAMQFNHLLGGHGILVDVPPPAEHTMKSKDRAAKENLSRHKKQRAWAKERKRGRDHQDAAEHTQKQN